MSNEKVPHFASEDEERAFWATHDTADYFDYAEAHLTLLPNLRRILTVGGSQQEARSERASNGHHPSNEALNPQN